MVAKPAKAPAELIALITEIDRKLKLIGDLTGEEVSELKEISDDWHPRPDDR